MNLKKTSQLINTPLDFKPTLIISKELQSQIMFLHNKIKDIEWSGNLFYSIVSGNITDPDNFVIKAEKIFLGDIGVGTYTEMTTDETIIDFYDAYPDAITWKQGYIHTHHSMQTFFSGTDMQELYDNAGSHNYYLSLIVNHKSEFCAKIAIVAEYDVPETRESYKFRGNNSAEQFEFKKEAKKEEILMLMDCIINFEQNQFEIDRYEAIKAKKVIKPIYNYANYNKANHGKQYHNQANAWPEIDFSDNYQKDYNYTTTESRLTKDAKITEKNVDEITFRSFVAKWLAQDITNESLVSDNLGVINKMNYTQAEEHIESLDRNLIGFIKDVLLIEDQDETQKIIVRLEKLIKECTFKHNNKVLFMLGSYTKPIKTTT